MNTIVRIVSLSLYAFILFEIISCKSVPENKENSIYIMIYDYENHALKDVKVSQGSVTKTISDVYGRALIQPEKNNVKNLVFEKNGYKTVQAEFGTEKEQVLYIKMGTASYFAKQSEIKLDEQKYEDALVLINNALEIEHRRDYEYLKNVIEEKLK